MLYLLVEHSYSSSLKQHTMERVNFGYSVKNIPILNNQQYLKCLLSKLNSFIRRLRWKVFYADRHSDCKEANDFNNYGFKFENCPPQNNDLLFFEADLYNMARSLRFRRVNKPFQSKLAKDASTINTSTALYVSAAKTTSLYKV